VDFAELAILVGTALGSAISTYQVAKKRVGKDHTAQLAFLRRQITELREKKQQPTLSDERIREILDRTLKDYVTTEEFDVYTRMDTERRERLIEGIGELRGTVAALRDRR
jgi:hypothetical protein